MLKLHGLDISGFKSFVDPVTTEFAGGITAIVGPNGCGKSNLSEAVTWVLGEQSAKSLRSGTMEDVIFNGSEGRRPLGMAEVTLTLETDSSVTDSLDGRITLGRRVFRTGESQYRLNGKVVRLKQIKDLLMDTGLGIRAYSVIEQGRIGMILSGKPQDRRKLLEEAAGITRYKARKRIAEVKLEEAMANLLRLEDIIAEVERALRSLKRQANSARRFQQREGEYRQLLQEVLQRRWARLDQRLRGLNSQLGGATERGAEVTAALHRDEAELAKARETLEELAQALSERHRRQAELAATVEGRQEFLKGARQTLQEIQERVEKGQVVAKEQQGELATHRQELVERQSQSDVVHSERDQAEVAVAQDRQEIATATELLTRSEAKMEALRSRLLVSMGEVTGVQSRLHREQIEGEKGNYRLEHRQQEVTASQREIEESATALKASQDNVQALERRLAELTEELGGISASLEQTLEKEGRASDRRRKLQERLHTVEQRRAVLQELAEADVERRSSLTQALQSLGLGDIQFLADELRVPEGWESSLDLYLDQLEDAILVPPAEDPLFLARSLSTSRSQAILLRPVAPGEVPRSRAPVDDAIVAPLGEALGLPEEFAGALPPAYLVRTPEDAQRLAPQHPGYAFISPERLWAQSGTLHLRGDESHPGILARNAELEEISRGIPELETDITSTSRELDSLVSERTRWAAESNRVEGAMADLRQEVAVGQARTQDAANRHHRVTASHETLVEEEAEIRQELKANAERQEQLRQSLSEAQNRHQELETAFDQAQTEVAEAREKRELLRTAGAGRQGRLELLIERVDSHTNETRRLNRQVEELQFQLSRWDGEEANLNRRRQEIEGARTQAEEELQTALEKRATSQDETLKREEQLDEHRRGVRELEEHVEGRRSKREEVQGEIQEFRVSQASLLQEVEHLKTSYEEQFQQSLPEAPEPVAPEAAELTVLETDLEQRKATLERMGPVNVLAAEEYGEQEERHRFLTEQRSDVAASVERLRSTIREINQTSSERFEKTFHLVNEHFKKTFTELFRGGEAEMRLLDEEDLLESGIEIVARPPGKRFQNIMLLSGGEKALTAIALLFALFQTKPSPFCILDEVDAPLDDANILRFVELLKNMSKETQFLIITHNKLTMEAASTLYGVTMEEKGVSKLVAVELDELHPQEEHAAAAV